MDKNDFRKEVKRDLKVMKRNKVISALIYVAIGVVLLAWPGETLAAVSKLIGLILAFGGAVAVVMYFVNGSRALFSYAGLAGGVIVAVIGLWLFFNPEFLIQLIPTIVGLLLIISGLVNLSEAFTIKKEHGEGVLMSVILAAITIVLGLLIFLCQMQFSYLLTRLMGIALVYDGVSDLLIISKITGVVKTVELAAEQAARDAEALDVTAAAVEKDAPVEESAETAEKKPRFRFGWGRKDKAEKPAEDTTAPLHAASEEDFVPDEGTAEVTPAPETADAVVETVEETVAVFGTEEPAADTAAVTDEETTEQPASDLETSGSDTFTF